MNFIEINDQMSVSGQLVLKDLEELASRKIEMLICNRPDGEDEGQLSYKEIAKVASDLGMETHMLAFASYQIQAEDRDKLIELVKQNKKMHMYCRSGARSKRLWRMANELGCGGHDYKAEV